MLGTQHLNSSPIHGARKPPRKKEDSSSMTRTKPTTQPSPLTQSLALTSHQPSLAELYVIIGLSLVYMISSKLGTVSL